MFIAILFGAAAVAGVSYAVKHHITVAKAKAEAEAVVAKVKAEVDKLESEAKSEVSTLSADAKAAYKVAVARIKQIF